MLPKKSLHLHDVVSSISDQFNTKSAQNSFSESHEREHLNRRWNFILIRSHHRRTYGFSSKTRREGAEHVTDMAIYSFNHDSFGLTTNRPGAAGDNVRYNADLSKTQTSEFLGANARHLEEHGVHRPDSEIEAHLGVLRQGRSAAENAAYNAREEACYAVRSHIIPPGPNEAEAWFHAQEKGERKNARMSDRFIGALPRELTPDQCVEAVENFCREVTQNRVPWHFALHLELDQRNQPDWNPHAHIILRDRDTETGRRFLYTSAGPKERAKLLANGVQFWDTSGFRRKWNDIVNTALERAGQDIRIDHRSLKEQGIDREPQIHIGPASQNATRKGYPLDSQDRQRGNRTIPYTLLDNSTRAEHNATVIEEGRRRLPPGPHSSNHPEQVKLRDAQAKVRRMMYDEQKLDRLALRQVQTAQLDQHGVWAKKLYADARQAAFEQVGQEMADGWKAARTIEDAAKRDAALKVLKRQQKDLYAKTSALHIAKARIEKDQAWQALRNDQLNDRLGLRTTHRDEYATLSRQQVHERLGIGERIRAKSLQSGANRLAARFSGYAGMTAQQGAAQGAIRLARKASLHSASVRPDDIALALMTAAGDERDRRRSIRGALNAQRQTNQLRGATPEYLHAQSRRSQSAGERTNAPQSVQQRLDAQDRTASIARIVSVVPQHHRGRDRGGGGRGR
jgi:hypothetical protein